MRPFVGGLVQQVAELHLNGHLGEVSILMLHASSRAMRGFSSTH